MKASFARPVLVSALFLTIIGLTLQDLPSAAGIPGDEGTIVHVLNRVGFGPRPGDVERVRAIGVREYIDRQLHPDRIPDLAMSARLSGLRTVGMSSRDIAREYAIPALEARRQRKQAGAAGAGSNPSDPGTGIGLPGSDSRPLMPDPAQQRANRVVLELGEQKILRAAYSDRQLEEVLTDFWFNHFNVDARKGPDRFLLTEYEREAIRPHVLGRFRDLLEATAKSPAMLFYLDNWMSADPGGPRPDTPPRGLNENYGRELMELHTVGVDGGYTQKDVTEVARSFTGWTIQNPRMGGGFRFEPRLHDEGPKVVLGRVIKSGGGIEDGEQVLDILANHPSTARFIATKLARRFVSDTPPPALVERAAARFRETGGDLREVTRTILTSTEFLSPDVYRAKLKTPFEFVVSALRATSADVEDALPLVRAIQQLGMPLYQCQPPTGYKDTADAWVNTGGLVGRMNFALQLSTVIGRQSSVASPQSSVDSHDFVRRVLGDGVSESTKATIAKATSATQMVALTLGSPEFQGR